jgi:Putative peptidoglycan binding domain
MARTMGDATGANASALTLRPLQLVAGYDTGTPDIKWTDSDWAMFPGKVQVHIDQGYGDTRSAEAHALVFDVEAGAFSPDQAAALIAASTAARPTIYVNRDNEDATVASARQAPNWKGDIWLAYPGWRPGMPLPVPPGCQIVAVQDTYTADYDLSYVLDDSWPDIPPAPPAPNWTEKMIQVLPNVRPGDIGVYVKRVQGLCTADGRVLVIDGIYGPNTQAAVKNIQSAAGIRIDGIVGPQTWPVLLGV